MTVTTRDAQVGAYLESVSAALADLSPDERDDLLGEVEASLLEAAKEDDAPLAERLGPPEVFAAELRAAAGLSPAPPPASAGAREAVRAALQSIATDPRLRAGGRIARELAPVWWVARGYVAVAALAMLTDQGWPNAHPLVPYLGSPAVSVIALVCAVCGSVWLGLRSRRGDGHRRAPLIAANLLLALAAVPVVGHVLTPGDRTELLLAPAPPPAIPGGDASTGITGANGRAVTNIYPYSRDGRLLLDVRLYDQAGRPLNLIGRDPNRRVLRTGEGRRILNSFPVRYRDPGTNRVTDPTAGPRIAAPKVATPALPTAAP